MKPTPDDGMNDPVRFDNGFSVGFRIIYDHIEAIARKNLRDRSSAVIKFQLYFIHGESDTSRTPMIRRPHYARYETQDKSRVPVRTSTRPGRGFDDDDDSDYIYDDDLSFRSDVDYEEDGDGEYAEHVVPAPDEQKPVFTLEFTKDGGKLRTTESSMDKDVMECWKNGGCSRCRRKVPA